jgi:hypothetical protein
MLTSVTTPSTLALRLRALAPRVRSLGDRPVYELLCELVSLSSAAMSRVEAYAALDLHTDFIELNGGRDLPPNIRVVIGSTR